ncbi:MAG TPA: hypothetical protein VF053_05805 [Streptosporangiales bacterium]
MTSLFWLLVAAVVLVSAALWANWTASRLDRLHHLVETARAALDAQLVRRSAVAIEVASSGLLDPASSVLLADAAHHARAAAEADREYAESALSAALRAVLGDPELRSEMGDGAAGRELLDEMDTASRRVQLARTFHNDAVTAAVRVRRKRLVRWLRLAGNAGMPEYFEIDDAPPPADPAATPLS